MINEKPQHSKIDPKDYVFSEETIASLVELGLLYKEIHLELEDEKKSKNITNGENKHNRTEDHQGD